MIFLWIVLLAGGLTLLITGTLPIGRFPSFASEVSIMRAPYGRILGAAILLYFIFLKVLVPAHRSAITIILSIALMLTALICMVLSLQGEKR
jgi:hypothetical protein